MPIANKLIRRAALHTGLSAGYISRVLRGKRQPRLPTLEAIASAMNMSVGALVIEIHKRKVNGTDPEVSRRISEGLRRKYRAGAEDKYRGEEKRENDERREGDDPDVEPEGSVGRSDSQGRAQVA